MEGRDDEAEQGHIREVLLLVLSYLPVYELLVASRVCRFLGDAAKNEVMLWSNVVVDGPLPSRLTDQTLVEVASRAAGKLRTLVLRNCFRISDDGLQRVARMNPLIQKLWLPGCTGLTPEGVIIAVKALPNLKTLHVRGIYNLTEHHLSELRSYIPGQLSSHLFFYQNHRQEPTTAPESPIDVEVCPRCKEVRMVYSCTRMPCETKISKDGRFQRECRACVVCIPRCEECGGCVDANQEPEESACGDVLCSECWLGLPKCNMCNKPYCRFHARIRHGSYGGHMDFICEVCQGKSNVITSDDDSET